MNTVEKLTKIKSKLELISKQDYRPDTSLPAVPTNTVSMALSLIAAIDGLQSIINLGPGTTDYVVAIHTRQDIADAWPGELL